MNVRDSIIQRHNEKLLLTIYFVVMLFFSAILFRTLGLAWRASDIARPGILWLNARLSVTLEEFAAAGFGLYLGLWLLFAIDPKKRWQALLMGFGTMTGLIGLYSVDLFIPNIDFTEHFLWLIGGGIVGIAIGGGKQLFDSKTTEAREFRSAARGLSVLISGIIILGLIEYHVALPQIFGPNGEELSLGANPVSFALVTDNIIQNVVAGSIFITVLQRFIEYDAEESFFVLGPPGSGKSLFLVGLYINALDEAERRDSDTPIHPSSELMSLVDDIEQDYEGWGVARTTEGQVNTLRFRYLKGRVFPKNLNISTLDYAGEYLRDLPDVMMSAEDEVDDPTLRRLAGEVNDADTLIFVIDIEQYRSANGLNIEQYFDIIQAVQNKRVLLVGTKADVLAEEFRETQAMEAHRYFDEFTQYVNDELQHNNQIRTLVQDTAGSQIHPVYYQTKVNDAGERVPLRNDNGNIMTVGFDHVLDRIGG